MDANSTALETRLDNADKMFMEAEIAELFRHCYCHQLASMPSGERKFICGFCEQGLLERIAELEAQLKDLEQIR